MSKRCCEGCGKPLERNKGEAPANFAVRKNCDRSCATIVQRRIQRAASIERAKARVSTCEICGVQFSPPADKPLGANTRMNRCCSKACSNELRRRSVSAACRHGSLGDPKWPDGDPLGDALRAAKRGHHGDNFEPGDNGPLPGALVIPRSMTGNSSAMCAL